MMEVKLLGGKGRAEYAETRLTEFVANCRRKKMAVTPQRLAVMRALLESGDHPRAGRIYARVRGLRRQHPRASSRRLRALQAGRGCRGARVRHLARRTTSDR